VLQRILRRIGWFFGMGNGKEDSVKPPHVIEEIKVSRPNIEDTQFMMLLSSNKAVQRKIEACTDFLEARIRTEEEHLGTSTTPD
jgi:hypothetical protein